MKKILAIVLCLVMVLCLGACGPAATPNGDEGAAKNQTAGQKAAAEGTLNVCLASEPDTLDPALNSAVDGATLVSHLFSGLAKWSQDKDGKLILVADCAKELVEGVANEDGTVTYTYTLKDGLKWSDGKDVVAGDFVFAWNRATSVALGADYGYMFDVIKGYDEIWAEGATGEEKLAVEAVDAKTLKVTLKNSVAYWNELLAFPTYFPVREDVVASEKWATEAATYVCNGAYTIADWTHDSVITLSKNANYHDAAAVTMNTIKFHLSDDANNMLANFKNGDWLMIDDVPTNEIATLKAQYPNEYIVTGQIGTYYVCWNVNENILPATSTLTGVDAEKAKAEIRNALALIIDRNYIVEAISQAGEVPASSFVAMGMTNPDGTQFYQTANSTTDDFDGYYNIAKDAFTANFNSAVETLKKYYTYDEASKKFTDVPSLTYIYNTNDAHKAIAEYLQSAFASVGITMSLTNQEWATFLNTRKDGNYSVARNGWIADYNDPICFLDMWISNSGNNDVQFGKGDHAALKMYNLDLTSFGYETKVENGTWAETYDVLIATIKSCTDNEKRYQLMHVAEDMLMATGCIAPIYFYTDIYMVDDQLQGFFTNPLGYKYFMYCTVK